MIRPSKLAQPRGFTLVELQVALLLVSLMTVLMVAALRLSAQTWTKVANSQDISEHRFMINQFVRRHLSNMRFLRTRTDDGKSIIGFFGNNEKLTFTAPYPVFENSGELYWWTMHSIWNPEQERYQLVLDYQPFVAGQPVTVLPDNDLVVEGDLPERIVVANNIRLEETEFFGRDDQNNEDWYDEWYSRNQSPLVIRLLFKEVDNEGFETVLPEVAITPRFGNRFLYSEEEQ